MSLVPVDPRSEASVLTLLETAASWLSEAVHRGDPASIAMVKAQIATAAEATKQLGLSKEIQLDAIEMVRRAEYALGKAIRKGQEEGTIRTTGEHAKTYDRWNGAHHQSTSSTKASPKDFAAAGELAGGRGGDGIYAMVDEAEPEHFEQALTEAKAEGNLSRANVIRKVRNEAGLTTRNDRAALITDLARQGYSSRQMPSRVGISEETIRDIAREHGIEIPADKAIRKTRRHDSNRIAAETVASLEGLAMGVDLIDYTELDAAEKAHWADSLTHSLKTLNRFAKQIKETTQ